MAFFKTDALRVVCPGGSQKATSHADIPNTMILVLTRGRKKFPPNVTLGVLKAQLKRVMKLIHSLFLYDLNRFIKGDIS